MSKIILELVLMLLNVALMIVNYKAERFGAALFNAFAAGVCFMGLITMLLEIL